MQAGRPLALTGPVVAAIVKLVRKGIIPRRAGRSIGFSEHTINRWMNVGRRERKHREAGGEPDVNLDVYVDLVQKAEAAQNAYIRKLVKRIDVASTDPKNWQAAIALLKAFDPEVFNLDLAKEIKKLWDELKRLKGEK